MFMRMSWQTWSGDNRFSIVGKSSAHVHSLQGHSQIMRDHRLTSIPLFSLPHLCIFCYSVQVIRTPLLLIWDNAAWHVSKAVRGWVHDHNRRVKQGQSGVRIVLCVLPSKSPWLNAIEPKWVHGKRTITEPDRLLSAQELADRACNYYGCDHEPHLVQAQKAA